MFLGDDSDYYENIENHGEVQTIQRMPPFGTSDEDIQTRIIKRVRESLKIDIFRRVLTISSLGDAHGIQMDTDKKKTQKKRRRVSLTHNLATD